MLAMEQLTLTLPLTLTLTLTLTTVAQRDAGDGLAQPHRVYDRLDGLAYVREGGGLAVGQRDPVTARACLRRPRASASLGPSAAGAAPATSGLLPTRRRALDDDGWWLLGLTRSPAQAVRRPALVLGHLWEEPHRRSSRLARDVLRC